MEIRSPRRAGRAAAALALAACLLGSPGGGHAATAQQVQAVEIPAVQVRTAHQARCGAADSGAGRAQNCQRLSAAGAVG